MKFFIILLIVIATIVGAVFFFLFPGEVHEEPAPEIDQETEVSPELPDVTLTPRTVSFADGSQATYQLARGFDISVAAEALGKARFMAMSPDGRLFVPDMVDYQLSHEGKLFVLEDFNEETGRFETKRTFLSGLRGPNSVAFYTDETGQHWLYLALTAHLLRYPYNPGDTAPSGEPEVVIEFPNTQTPGETSVVWHITRTLLFHEDTLYISIGSGCNSCEQLEGALRGMIIAMNPDGSNVRRYADGLRNSVGLTWAEDSLYATENGVDHLGSTAPDEVLYKIDEGGHYGWPYCYESDGALMQDDSQQWTRQPFPCSAAPQSLASFAPRGAPLGVTYFENAHPLLEGTFLVALHGSFVPSVGSGYEVVRVSKDGEKQIFMDGFQLENYERVGRPVDMLQYNENSFFLSDDHRGVIYFISAR